MKLLTKIDFRRTFIRRESRFFFWFTLYTFLLLACCRHTLVGQPTSSSQSARVLYLTPVVDNIWPWWFIFSNPTCLVSGAQRNSTVVTGFQFIGRGRSRMYSIVIYTSVSVLAHARWGHWISDKRQVLNILIISATTAPILLIVSFLTGLLDVCPILSAMLKGEISVTPLDKYWNVLHLLAPRRLVRIAKKTRKNGVESIELVLSKSNSPDSTTATMSLMDMAVRVL